MISHKQGEKILFSRGEYSNYGVGPLVQALRDLDLASLAQAYYDQAPMYTHDPAHKAVSGSAFAAWLVAQCWAEEIDYDEAWTGPYGFEFEEIARCAEQRALAIQKIDSDDLARN